MMMKTLGVPVLLMGCVAACALGQTTAPVVGGGSDPEARKVLEVLRDRKGTLKDFVGKVEYSVLNPITEEVSGKRGTVAVVVDEKKGVMFTVDFTIRTVDGKARAMQHQQLIFDGETMMVKDFDPKQYIKNRVVPEGGKSSDATTLNGPMTLPIGLDPGEVEKAFVVTSVPVKEAGRKGIKLVPREGGKFDFRSLEVAVEEKTQLPVKLVQVAKNKDVTTIEFTEIEVNGGKAKMEGQDVPAGWTERKGG